MPLIWLKEELTSEAAPNSSIILLLCKTCQSFLHHSTHKKWMDKSAPWDKCERALEPGGYLSSDSNWQVSSDIAKSLRGLSEY